MGRIGITPIQFIHLESLGIGNVFTTAQSTTPTGNAILLENGMAILRENGQELLVE